MAASCPDGGGELLSVDLVPPGQDVDVGEVSVASRRVPSVDHGDDLLGEHCLERVADEFERIAEERG